VGNCEQDEWEDLEREGQINAEEETARLALILGLKKQSNRRAGSVECGGRGGWVRIGNDKQATYQSRSSQLQLVIP